jgi:hypothetical protein
MARLSLALASIDVDVDVVDVEDSEAGVWLANARSAAILFGSRRWNLDNNCSDGRRTGSNCDSSLAFGTSGLLRFHIHAITSPKVYNQRNRPISKQ